MNLLELQVLLVIIRRVGDADQHLVCRAAGIDVDGAVPAGGVAHVFRQCGDHPAQRLRLDERAEVLAGSAGLEPTRTPNPADVRVSGR